MVMWPDEPQTFRGQWLHVHDTGCTSACLPRWCSGSVRAVGGGARHAAALIGLLPFRRPVRGLPIGLSGAASGHDLISRWPAARFHVA